MKIVFQKDTKKIKECFDFDQLVSLVTKIFNLKNGIKIGCNVRFFYMDEEFDVISIDCQDDLDQAREIQSLKLVIAESSDEARQALEQGAASIMSMSLI